MPYLGNDALSLILDIVTAFAPAILTVLAGWALWAYGWLKKKEANNAQFAAIDAVARQAVAAAEQAIAAADTQGKFAYAAAVLHARFPQLDQKRTTAAIEAAVAALKMLPNVDSVSATATSPSVQPILDKLARPTVGQRVGAENEAILRQIRADMVRIEKAMGTRLEVLQDDVNGAWQRIAAAEQAIKTPQATTGTKKVVATVTPATPTEAPTAATTPAAPAQP